MEWCNEFSFLAALDGLLNAFYCYCCWSVVSVACMHGIVIGFLVGWTYIWKPTSRSRAGYLDGSLKRVGILCLLSCGGFYFILVLMGVVGG